MYILYILSSDDDLLVLNPTNCKNR